MLIVIATVFDVILYWISPDSIDVDDDDVNLSDVAGGLTATMTTSITSREGVSTEAFSPVGDDAPLLGRHTSLLHPGVVKPSTSESL